MLQRDRIITELRLRLPASAERDQLIAKVTASTTSAANQQQEDVAGQEHAMKVAAATVSSLQARDFSVVFMLKACAIFNKNKNPRMFACLSELFIL